MPSPFELVGVSAAHCVPTGAGHCVHWAAADKADTAAAHGNLLIQRVLAEHLTMCLAL